MPNSSSETAALVQRLREQIKIWRVMAGAGGSNIVPGDEVGALARWTAVEMCADELERLMQADALTPRTYDPCGEEVEVGSGKGGYPCPQSKGHHGPHGVITPRTQEPPTPDDAVDQRCLEAERTLAERARWYMDGCDGLEDVAAYLSSGDVARDAASDLDSAIGVIQSWRSKASALAGDRQRLTEERDEWESKAKALTQALINERLRKGFGS